MEKLDRLGWVAGFSFTSYGVRIGVRFNDPTVDEQVVPLLPPGWRRASSPAVDRLYSLLAGRPAARPGISTFNLAYADELRIARARDVEDVLQSVESDLQLYIAKSARNRIFVHAGVVEWSNKAIIIPGRSFSGKTTLVAELVRAGATFYSDEYAVFDKTGRVHPYPKPLSIRDLLGRQKKCTPESLGGSSGHKAIPIGDVVVSSFKAGPRWRPTIASAGQGVLALLANTVAARRKPDISLDAFHLGLDKALILIGSRGEARATAASILEAFSAANK